MASSSKKPTPLSLPSTDNGGATSTGTTLLCPSQADACLSTASHLTRQELLRRRISRIRSLSRVYRDHYWALMEHFRAQYRHYYWTYGVSPFFPPIDPVLNNSAEDCAETSAIAADNHHNNVPNLAVANNCGNEGGGSQLGFGEYNTCKSVSNDGAHRCKLKAMAMTNFCHFHILSDPNQKLYKPCIFVIKAPEQGQILCGKPVLRSSVPSLCKIHSSRTAKDVKHALKKAGLTASSSARLAPKFHVVVAEYVKLIQSKRRALQKLNKKSNVVKEELSS